MLYEKRNLSRTATRLSVSASKASRLLASARRVFGDELYIRCGQGVTPTAKAHEITRQAKRVLEEMQRFFVEERFDPRKMNRVIRLACVDNAIPIMIEPAIEKLFHDAPKAGLALIPHGERTILRMLAGEIDLSGRQSPRGFSVPPAFENAVCERRARRAPFGSETQKRRSEGGGFETLSAHSNLRLPIAA